MWRLRFGGKEEEGGYCSGKMSEGCGWWEAGCQLQKEDSSSGTEVGDLCIEGKRGEYCRIMDIDYGFCYEVVLVVQSAEELDGW